MQPPGGPSAADELVSAWLRHGLPRARFVGGNAVRLLQGGDELFPSMVESIERAHAEVWFATYIFHDDGAAQRVADALIAAAQRGVQVRVVVDGFGSNRTLATLRRWFAGSPLQFHVFRPLDRWWAWLQPGQMRRLHHKLCVVDGEVAFVGGINIIDDRHDVNHGWTEDARLDFAVELRGPIVDSVLRATRAMWVRAQLGRRWRDEVRALAHSARPLLHTLQLIGELRSTPAPGEALAGVADINPVRVAFVVRDNLRQRRAIERSYIEAIRHARQRVDIACAYFYPGRSFRRALREAARRGVQVRLLLQGKLDYLFAGMAARALYDEMLRHGIRIYEYMPAFLHAKVAVVDDDWATVGSSNIDPLSLLLNLEANAMVRDAEFAQRLAFALESAMAVSREITASALRPGWRGWLGRGFVAWVAGIYLRLAGITSRY